MIRLLLNETLNGKFGIGTFTKTKTTKSPFFISETTKKQQPTSHKQNEKENQIRLINILTLE